ncbi:glycosyltransferase family 2 protein [Pseudobutyrivibrio ruminis]|uniref:glycosyltransferase family 2 protein n=1 Tax=Pseudobutyrivibrio ruminis TaxID=46206 RepID=UPI0004052CE4|nr:glycosyltransferase [Pseudobutyrivibrio ruminis]
MNEKKVSIIVPTYNHEEYIIDCLESIKDQDYENIELIIGDDVSSDKTYEKAQKWVKENEDRFNACVIYRNENNLGISRNMNELVKKTTGDYIKSIASDDLLLPNAISSLVEYLEQNNDEIVFANAYRINEQSKWPLNNNYELFYRKIPPSGNDILNYLYDSSYIAAPTVLFRKGTFDKYGLFREDLCFEDWEYWLRLAAKGASIGYLDKPLVGYRFLDESASHFSAGQEEEARFLRFAQSEKKMLEEYKEYVDNGMINYWNRNFIACMDNKYDLALEQLLASEDCCVSAGIRVRLFFYRIHMYSIIKKIIHYMKSGGSKCK